MSPLLPPSSPLRHAAEERQLTRTQLLDNAVRRQPPYGSSPKRATAPRPPSPPVRSSSPPPLPAHASTRWTTLKVGSTLAQITALPEDPSIQFSRSLPGSGESEENWEKEDLPGRSYY